VADAAVPLGRGGDQVIPRPALVRPGPGAWWSRPGATPPGHVPVAAVRRALRGLEPSAPPWGDDGYEHSPLELRLPDAARRPAAVLCALWDDGGEASVVLTRRSARLRSHTGEVAFPGGRLDDGETAVDAALREAQEEVGIDPADVEVIGRLSSLATVGTGAAMTPFVGVLSGPPRLRPNPAEVARAFSVPLVELMAPGVYHEERWVLEGFSERSIHVFEVPGDTVWGATARVLRELLDRVCPHPA
jgi:8-oxo-dGTP pyrophosphatase MutT (NUDIX family)